MSETPKMTPKRLQRIERALIEGRIFQTLSIGDVDALCKELRKAQEDTERLDWLLTHIFIANDNLIGSTWNRIAIDVERARTNQMK